jgi:tetratricopeptide (TPR) repeat protein
LTILDKIGQKPFMRHTHMHVWFPGLVALLFLGAGCSRPEDYLERGKRASARGDQAEAVLDFRKAIQKNPQYVDAFRELGHSQFALGDREGSLASLGRALQLRPGDDSLRAEVGDAALALYLADPRRPKVQYDQVAKIAQELLAKDPKSFDGLRFQASLLYTDNRVEEAIAAFRKANAVKPMMPGVVLPLVDALWKNGQTAEAENLAVELVKQHKDYLQTYDWLYGMYESTNRPAQAEAILVQKAANNPNDARSILQLAAYYAQAKKPVEMVAALNQMLQRPKDFPARFFMLGDFYAGLRNWGEATRWFNTGINQDPKNTREYQKRLVAVYVNQQKRKEALDLLARLIQERPNEWSLRVERAEIWIAGKDKEDLARAITECQTLVTGLPRDPRMKFLLGRAYFEKGDKEAAGKAFAQAAAQARSFLEPRIALAGLDRETANFKETVRLADEILAVDPNNFSGRLLHASGSRGLGNLDIAERELEALAREAPQSPDVQLELGLVSLARKQYAAAERMFNSLYQSSRSDVRALAGLAEVYLAEGQGDRAVQMVTGEVNRLPNSMEMRELLAATALNAGKRDVALEQYQKLTQMAPDNARYFVNLADLFREKSDYENEVTALDKASKLAPDNAVVAGRLALAEDLSGNKKQAAVEYKRSLDLAPTDPALLNNRAFFIAEDGGNLDEALEYSQAAVRKVPGNPDLLDTLAWVYTKRKMADSAIEILDKLVRQNPDRSSFHYHLGTALALKGDKAKAKAELAVALTKKPAPDEEEKIKDLIGKLQ